MIFGLSAAFSWGFSDFGASVVGRRLGSVATLLIAQAAGIVLVLFMVLVLQPTWSMTPTIVAGLALNGIAAAVGYALLYRALELGPVALVSPVVAAYAVITITLAVTVLGESLPGIVLLGGLITVAGVILTTADPRLLGKQRRSGGNPGVPYAFGAMALFGVAAFLLGRYSQDIGWLAALTVSRMSTLICLSIVWLNSRRGVPSGVPTVLAGAALVGILDVMGASAFARGSELGYVSIVAAASAIFPLIPVAGGILLFRERPAFTQYVGVALVIGGLLFLSRGV